MKENIDVISAIAGGVGALLKGSRKKRSLKNRLIDMSIGVILGYSTIGLLDYFLEDANSKTIMLISFSVGWLANELTDGIERITKKYIDKKTEDND